MSDVVACSCPTCTGVLPDTAVAQVITIRSVEPETEPPITVYRCPFCYGTHEGWWPLDGALDGHAITPCTQDWVKLTW